MNLEPVDPQALRERLNQGTVQFAFKKVGGDLRIAVGTTDLSLIPPQHHPGHGKYSRNSQGQVCYFDVQKQVWRSVSTSKEIFLP
jgi:hypothetical protein